MKIISKTLEVLIYLCMCGQILLVAGGIYCLSIGDIYTGIFNIVVNSACFVVNIHTLRYKG